MKLFQRAKQFFLCVVVCTGLAFAATGVHAQIPLTVTSDLPATINQIETIAKWGEQLSSMSKQLDQMKLQLYVINPFGNSKRLHEASRGAFGRSLRKQPCQAKRGMKIEVVSFGLGRVIYDFDGTRRPELTFGEEGYFEKERH